MITVVKAGLLTTVQDLGRPGYGSMGVGAGGAMDAVALRLANLLVANDEGAAGLELTLIGPVIRFEQPAVVAFAGARLGHDRPHLEAFHVAAGEEIDCAKTTEGARGYVAVRGGIAAEPVLGSRSTAVSTGLGPGPLRAGDGLPIGPSSHAPLRRSRGGVEHGPDVRVVSGPQGDAFTEPGAFLDRPWSVSQRSDRAGVRLEGEALTHRGGADIAPEGLAPGAIQVPGGGMPIVLGADRPATGGYAKIATVITADLSMIAQARPGDTLRFTAVDVDQARAAWRERERALFAQIEEIG